MNFEKDSMIAKLLFKDYLAETNNYIDTVNEYNKQWYVDWLLMEYKKRVESIIYKYKNAEDFKVCGVILEKHLLECIKSLEQLKTLF